MIALAHVAHAHMRAGWGYQSRLLARGYDAYSDTRARIMYGTQTIIETIDNMYRQTIITLTLKLESDNEHNNNNKKYYYYVACMMALCRESKFHILIYYSR